MSALWTLGVDNAVIDIDAGETPIMDGSACAYAKAITEVGITDQQAERKFYHVTEKMVYTIPEKGVAIILYPDDEFSVSLHVDYNSKVIGNQYATFNPGDNFADKIAPCRTFVFLHELEPLMKMNLIKGGDLDNAIVVVENPVSDASSWNTSQEDLQQARHPRSTDRLPQQPANCAATTNWRATSCSTCWATWHCWAYASRAASWANPPRAISPTRRCHEAAQAHHPQGAARSPVVPVYDCRQAARSTTSTDIRRTCCPTARRSCWWTAFSTATQRAWPASRTSR